MLTPKVTPLSPAQYAIAAKNANAIINWKR